MGLSRSHVRNIVVPLREMLNHTIDDGLLVSNPASRLGRFIEVRRNMSKGELSTPKNHKSRRVDMSMQLTNTLDALLAELKADTVRRNR